MKYIPVLLFYCLLPFLAAAQNDLATRSPYGIQDAALIEALMPALSGFGGSARDMLRQQSVKPYLMPVRKLGDRGTEATYMAAACLEYYINRDQNFKVNLSPDFIGLSLGKSASLRDALVFLIERGTVNAAVVAYDATTVPEVAFSVPTFRISNFLHIFRELSPARQRVFETKKALVRGHPVLVELKTDEAFQQSSGEAFVSPGNGNELHTVLVVGFDEAAGAFEVQACRGYDWGQNGYALIRFDDFDRAALNGYVLVRD